MNHNNSNTNVIFNEGSTFNPDLAERLTPREDKKPTPPATIPTKSSRKNLSNRQTPDTSRALFNLIVPTARGGEEE